MMAAFQAPIIMMSQNREAQKDRLRADLDYQVNLKNEMLLGEILRLLEKREKDAPKNTRMSSDNVARRQIPRAKRR